MKKFNELTIDQQIKAIEYAESEIKDMLKLGIIYFKKAITKTKLKEYALVMAEDALYNENSVSMVIKMRNKE
jgi:hypothetical protein